MTQYEPGERDARAYCRSIGADPDEMVHGVDEKRFGTRLSMLCPRWRWYIGVSDAALRRAI